MNNSYLEPTHSVQPVLGFKAANRHYSTNNVRVIFIILMNRLGLKKRILRKRGYGHKREN